MASADNLKSIVEKQKLVLSELEKESQAIAQSDLVKENEALKESFEKMKADCLSAENNAAVLSRQNSELKNALYEQIYNERLAILNLSTNKLSIYYNNAQTGEENKLAVFEKQVKSRIEAMLSVLRRNNVDRMDEIYRKLDEIAGLLDQKVTEAREEAAKTTGVFSENEKAEFEALKNEQLTENQVKQVAKKNNIEAFVGLNLLNKLGILLIIIGVIAASQYAYRQMPDSIKSVMMFSLGGIMLFAGELLSRKKVNVFSTGITAGGIGVLYASLVTSSLVLKLPFFIETYSMYPALAFIILITAAAFYLSLRYSSQTIAAFALIGGYLPIFKVSGSMNLLYYAMVYFAVLNLFSLLLSMNKKWPVSSFTGLLLNMAGTVYICQLIIEKTLPNGGAPAKLGLPQAATIVFTLFAFIIYTLIPVFGTYFKKSVFKTWDIVLLGINTYFSSFFIVSLFYQYNLQKYLGLLVVCFAAVFLLIGWFIKGRFKNGKNAASLFSITGFVFIILVVPFQFNKMWLTLGWLLEGTALTVYGILKNQKAFRIGGYIIDGLCVGSFLWVDLLMGSAYEYRHELGYDLFAYKYAMITLASLVILGAYIYKKIVSGKFQTVYKYIAAINLWFFFIYISFKMLNDVFGGALYEARYSSEYLSSALAITLTFLTAFIVPRIKILTDFGLKIISMILYGIGIVWLFIINTGFSPVYAETYDYATGLARAIPMKVHVVGSFVLAAVCLLSVFALMDFMKIIVMERKLGVEWYPLMVSAYFVIILTQNLIASYNMDFSNVIISMIYVLTALSWIIFGFVKRYKFIRVFGLALSFLAVSKLFLIDLRDLTQGYRIVSYFALGLALLAISFIYQHFNKRLELK